MIQLNLLAGSIDQDDGGFRSLRDDVEMKSPSDSNAVAGFTFERSFFSDIDFFRSEDLMKSQELLPACHGVQCHHVCWYGPYGRAH